MKLTTAIAYTLTTALGFMPIPVFAQSAPEFGNVVAACGSVNGAAYAANTNRPVTIDTSGHTCGNSIAVPVPGATTNSTVIVTSGGVFQTLTAANTARKSLDIQNICNKSGNCTATSNFCYIYIAGSGSGTTANSLILAPGQEYLRSAGSIPSDVVSGTCDGTSDKIYVAVQ